MNGRIEINRTICREFCAVQRGPLTGATVFYIRARKLKKQFCVCVIIFLFYIPYIWNQIIDLGHQSFWSFYQSTKHELSYKCLLCEKIVSDVIAVATAQESLLSFTSLSRRLTQTQQKWK